MAISFLIICFTISASSISTTDPKDTVPTTVGITSTSTSNTTKTLSSIQPQTNNSTSGGNNFHISSIEDFCLILQINEIDCSCKNDELHELYPGVVTDICSIEEVTATEYKSFPKERLTLALVATVTMIVGVIGNCMVLAISYKNRKDLPHTKVLIAQLALADAVFSINNFISEVHLFWSEKWVLGVGMCKLISSTNTLSSLLTIGYILIIAIERYFGILYTLRRSLSGKQMVYSCVIINIIAATGAVLPLMFSSGLDEFGVCSEVIVVGRKAEKVYNWCLIVLYIFVPICVISLIYIRIIRYLLTQATSNAAINREDIRRKRIKSNHRTMKILLTIMVAFVVCILPTRVIKLYLAYVRDGDINFGILKALRFVANISYPLHVCVNPMIYTAIDKECRNEMLGMLHLRRQHDSINRNQKTGAKRRATQVTDIECDE